MFRSMLVKSGLDPASDVTIKYAADPTQAAQMLLSGQSKSAVLSEAVATSVILKTKDGSNPCDGSSISALLGKRSTESVRALPISGHLCHCGGVGQAGRGGRVQVPVREGRGVDGGESEGGGRSVREAAAAAGVERGADGGILQEHQMGLRVGARCPCRSRGFSTHNSRCCLRRWWGKLPDDGFYYKP